MTKGEFKPLIKIGKFVIHRGDIGIVTGSIIVGFILGYYFGKKSPKVL